MSINLIEFNNFDIYMNYGTFINQNTLNDLYAPLIGNLAIQIYNSLVLEFNSRINTSIYINTYTKLLSKLNIEANQLIDSLKLLESVSLISTYIDNSNLQNPKAIHFINEPLNYFNFVQNENLNKLLRSKLTDNQYTELKYKYNNTIIKSSYVNVSKDISYLIDSDEKINIELDFTVLYTLVSKKISNHFILDDLSKEKINYYYKNHNFTLDQLSQCVYESLMIEENQYIISYNILIFKLQNILNQLTPKNFHTIKKINRKYDLFLNNVDIETYKLIYDDYTNNNSENYIISITKDEICFETKKMLKILREKFYLSDEIINCIIDYSLFRNFGRLVPNYILKVAKSINNLSIDSLKVVISYLTDVNINKKPIKSLYKNDANKNENKIINDENLDNIWKEL